jgi:hypothetical protein
MTVVHTHLLMLIVCIDHRHLFLSIYFNTCILKISIQVSKPMDRNKVPVILIN